MSDIEIALALCTRFEGLSLEPYLCPAKVPTIGYGTTFYPNKYKVSLSDPPITESQAREYLLHELKNCFAAMDRCCPEMIGQSDGRRAAIADFIYNLGITRFNASTLKKRIARDDWADVPYQLGRWVYANGKKLRGLEIRRQAEAALCYHS